MKNIYLYLFVIISALLIIFIFVKKYFSTNNTSEVYVKLKINSVINNQKNDWLLPHLKKLKERSLADPEIVKFYNYPYNQEYLGTDTYQENIYLIVKIRPLKLINNSYVYQRNPLIINSFFDLNIGNVQINALVMDISNQPFEENTVDKYIYLIKDNSSLKEYNAIQLNSKYFNGETNVFEILDKNYQEATKTIDIKGRIKLKQSDNNYIFGEEEKVLINKRMNIATNDINLNSYLVTGLE